LGSFATESSQWQVLPCPLGLESRSIFKARFALVLACIALNLVARFFNKAKPRRRIATRYDKPAANYLAFIKLAAIRIWLRTYESTP
jgi:transposase